MLSCNNTSIKNINDSSSLNKLKTELDTKFGADAFFTSLNIVYSDYGPIINTMQTEKPESNTMTEWNFGNGRWKKASNVTLEIPAGSKSTDFMFQLDKPISFELLGELIEKSKKTIITDKNLDEVRVESILINAPKSGDFSTMKYYITIAPANGGTKFNFIYSLDGSLDKMDY